MATMTSDEAFSQGARCGHIEGKARVGLYTVDEEFEASDVAAKAQELPTAALTDMWAVGYRHGYMLAVQGDALEREHQLPCDRCGK